MESKDQTVVEVSWAEINTEACENSSLIDMCSWKEFD